MRPARAAGAAGVPPPARLFVALWPDAPTRRAIAKCAATWSWPPAVRCVAPARLHATLHFLGSVARERVVPVADGLLVDFEPCSSTFDAVAMWPRGIAVIEATRPPRPVLDLHAALAQRLRALGIAIESRPWRCHVTLARDAAGAALPAQVDAIEWRSSDYALVESIPSPRAAYRVLRRYGRVAVEQAPAPGAGLD